MTSTALRDSLSQRIKMPPEEPIASREAHAILIELQIDFINSFVIEEDLVSERITRSGQIEFIESLIEARLEAEPRPLTFQAMTFID